LVAGYGIWSKLRLRLEMRRLRRELDDERKSAQLLRDRLVSADPDPDGSQPGAGSAIALSYQVLFTLFILALLLISWLLGYYARCRRLPELRPVPDADYFTGLNYLLNDDPDDAIDVFIDALEVNSSTFETHLALGKLLKRRGKVDRAIAHY